MPITSPARLPRDARRILSLIHALVESGSQLEDAYWEALLAEQIGKVLDARKNRHLESLLEHLADQNPEGYDILAEQAEALTESLTVRHEDVDYDALLISAPVLAWTRYMLPAGTLNPDQHEALHQGLLDEIALPGTRLALLPRLLSLEEMPASFHETRQMTRRLAQAALEGQHPGLDKQAQDVNHDGILADTRFLVGAIVIPRGQAIFRWQTRTGDSRGVREACRQAWSALCETVLSPLFAGCRTTYLPPDAYYSSNREADVQIRPLVLQASLTWLHTALNISPHELQASIIACGEVALQEYRIGLSLAGSDDVVYGCIWPVLSKEEAFAEVLDVEGLSVIEEITETLSEIGVMNIQRVPGMQSCDICEGCGAPYFPSPQGDLRHPELPEDADTEPVSLH